MSELSKALDILLGVNKTEEEKEKYSKKVEETIEKMLDKSEES